MSVPWALLAALVNIPVSSSAQSLPTPEPGTRIRVVLVSDATGAGRYDRKGLFVGRTDSAIVLDLGLNRLDTIPTLRVRRIDRQTGTW